MLTVEIYLDDVQTGFVGEDYFLIDDSADSPKRTYSVSAFLKDVPAAESVNIKVKMKTSNGTATIAAGMANLVIAARGVEG